MKNNRYKDKTRQNIQFPQKYRIEIVDVLESLDMAEDAFLKIFYGLNKSDQKIFAESMSASITAKMTRHYYLSRYLEPLKNVEIPQSDGESPSEYKQGFQSSLPDGLEYLVDKEMEILFNGSPKLRVAVEGPYPDLDWTDYFEESFPLIKKWVKTKEVELEDLKKFLSQFIHPFSTANYIDSGDSDSPSDLITEFEDKDSFPFDLTDYRIPFRNTTMDGLRKNLKEPFEKIKELIGDRPFKAFEYNTFNTADNPTTPTPLLLPIPPRQLKPLYKGIRSLGQATNDTYGIPQENFAKVLVLNFRKFREELNSSPDEERYLKNLAKRFGRNIQ